MIEDVEKLVSVMDKADEEIQSYYTVILVVAANLIPSILYIFFYKRYYFIKWDMFKLILISISLGLPIFTFNYFCIDYANKYETLNTQNLANLAIKDYKTKHKGKIKQVSDKEILDSMVNAIDLAFKKRNKNILFRTSLKMLIVLSLTILISYYLGMAQLFLKYQISVFINIEILFFLFPILMAKRQFAKQLKTGNKSKKPNENIRDFNQKKSS